MKFNRNFDIAKIRELAKACDNKQVVADVGFMQFLHYHGKLHVLWGDAGFAGWYHKQDKTTRIVAIGTPMQYRGQGWGKLLLQAICKDAKENGSEWVETRTTSGQRFYLRNGFEYVGRRGGDGFMKKRL